MIIANNNNKSHLVVFLAPFQSQFHLARLIFGSSIGSVPIFVSL